VFISIELGFFLLSSNYSRRILSSANGLRLELLHFTRYIIWCYSVFEANFTLVISLTFYLVFLWEQDSKEIKWECGKLLVLKYTHPRTNGRVYISTTLNAQKQF